MTQPFDSRRTPWTVDARQHRRIWVLPDWMLESVYARIVIRIVHDWINGHADFLEWNATPLSPHRVDVIPNGHLSGPREPISPYRVPGVSPELKVRCMFALDMPMQERAKQSEEWVKRWPTRGQLVALSQPTNSLCKNPVENDTSAFIYVDTRRGKELHDTIRSITCSPIFGVLCDTVCIHEMNNPLRPRSSDGSLNTNIAVLSESVFQQMSRTGVDMRLHHVTLVGPPSVVQNVCNSLDPIVQNRSTDEPTRRGGWLLDCESGQWERRICPDAVPIDLSPSIDIGTFALESHQIRRAPDWYMETITRVHPVVDLCTWFRTTTRVVTSALLQCMQPRDAIDDRPHADLVSVIVGYLCRCPCCLSTFRCSAYTL